MHRFSIALPHLPPLMWLAVVIIGNAFVLLGGAGGMSPAEMRAEYDFAVALHQLNSLLRHLVEDRKQR